MAFTSVNAFEVLANYTVYDYEKQVALARSFSYRQFSWMDSTAVELTRNVGLDFYAYLKLYERGMLRWDEFLERTENSTVDRTFSAQVRYAPDRTLTVALGVRYFSQSRYVYKDTIRRPDTFFSSCRADEPDPVGHQFNEPVVCSRAGMSGGSSRTAHSVRSRV